MTIHLPQNPQGDWASIVRQQEAEASALAEKHVAQRLALMPEEVKVQTAYFSHLGWLGQSFSAAFNKAAAPIDIDIKKVDCRATLWTHSITKGFLGEITLGKNIAMDNNAAAIFGALTHEGTHLLNQFKRVPAAHASPYNTRSPVVLCPRDAMVLSTLMERQAFAMELLMDDLLNEVRNFTGEVFEIPSAAVLQVKLQDYARMQNSRTRWNDEKSFLDYYRNNRMNDYEEFGRVAHLKDNAIGYARLGLADLRILNECMGMKTFGETDDDLSRLLTYDFTSDQQARLDRINKDLGIVNEDHLPLLEEALVVHGMTPESYLKMSVSRTAAVPAPQITPQEPPASVANDDLARGASPMQPKLALA